MSDISEENNIDNMPEPVGVTWGFSKLGKLYESWPKSDGKPEDAVFLKHCSSVDMEDDMLINMLFAYGIPAVKDYPQDGSFGKVVMGMSGSGTDIYVPASLLEDARGLMGGNDDE